jgi:hypothetical protein
MQDLFFKLYEKIQSLTITAFNVENCTLALLNFVNLNNTPYRFT